ncbi:hypothetical protein ABENE_06680 [Asticcacaulis benevestitus DSM 16100 = ATCC BAA-896]|uniref:Uncharacterized protein n=1 Tax=Asticcacaulis benevestitus DSM 16100 = ATCC BAA-896 TaxID=1121022 RepID=V4PH26_9CAUL|nr:hypothetical protein ABENE_06680 [Asticcacaulis benevestitus DSM 16100 = ATCC BAA-896]
MFKNRTVILICATGMTVLLGFTAAVLWKAPAEPANTHSSAVPWLIFTIFAVVYMNAKRRKMDSKIPDADTDEDKA